MMKLNGNLLIGAQEVSATAGTMKALNPATNVEIESPLGLVESQRSIARRN